MSIAYQEKFDLDAAQYQCCCQNIHVKTGATIIAILEVLYAVVRLVTIVTLGGSLSTMQIIEIVVTSCWLFIIFVLLYGLYADRQEYLMPYLLIQVVVILMMFVGAILCFVLLVSGTERIKLVIGDSATQQIHEQFDCEKRAQLLSIAMMAYFIAGQLLVWFFAVILGCYRYMRDKNIVMMKAYGATMVPGGLPTHSVAPTYMAHPNYQSTGFFR